MKDESELEKLNCPYCQEVIEVKRSWDGCKAACPYCGEKFIISLQEDADRSIREMKLPELSDYVVAVCKGASVTRTELELVKYKGILEDVAAELSFRQDQERDRAEAKLIEKIPCILKIFSRFILSHRRHSQEEQAVKALSDMTSGALVKVDVALKKAIRKRESERARQDILDKITHLVRTLRGECDAAMGCSILECQSGEVVYSISEGVQWDRPIGKRGWKYTEYHTPGSLIVTNKRVVFISDDHRQEFRIKNIRDFSPSWTISAVDKYCHHQIEIRTSDRRAETYELAEAWRPSLVVMFFWNESTRRSVLNGDGEEGVQSVWCKLINDPDAYELRNIELGIRHGL